MPPVCALLGQSCVWADTTLHLSPEIILSTTPRLGTKGVGLPVVIYEDATVCL